MVVDQYCDRPVFLRQVGSRRLENILRGDPVDGAGIVNQVVKISEQRLIIGAQTVKTFIRIESPDKIHPDLIIHLFQFCA